MTNKILKQKSALLEKSHKRYSKITALKSFRYFIQKVRYDREMVDYFLKSSKKTMVITAMRYWKQLPAVVAYDQASERKATFFRT